MRARLKQLMLPLPLWELDCQLDLYFGNFDSLSDRFLAPGNRAVTERKVVNYYQADLGLNLEEVKGMSVIEAGEPRLPMFAQGEGK